MSIHEATQTAVPTYPLARGRSLFRDLDRPAEAGAQLGANWFAPETGTGSVGPVALLVPHLPARQLRLTMPTLWIVLGPLGQSITAANLLGEVAHVELTAPYGSAFAAFGVVYGVPVWGFAALWVGLATALTLGQRIRRGTPPDPALA